MRDPLDGPVTAGVKAELDNLPGAVLRPTIAECCLAMARIIDDPQLVETAPAAMEALTLGLDNIRAIETYNDEPAKILAMPQKPTGRS